MAQFPPASHKAPLQSETVIYYYLKFSFHNQDYMLCFLTGKKAHWNIAMVANLV